MKGFELDSDHGSFVHESQSPKKCAEFEIGEGLVRVTLLLKRASFEEDEVHSKSTVLSHLMKSLHLFIFWWNGHRFQIFCVSYCLRLPVTIRSDAFLCVLLT